jgi:hypothetical protein
MRQIGKALKGKGHTRITNRLFYQLSYVGLLSGFYHLSADRLKLRPEKPVAEASKKLES